MAAKKDNLPDTPTAASWFNGTVHGVIARLDETRALLLRKDGSYHLAEVAKLQIVLYKKQSLTEFKKLVSSCKLSKALKTELIAARSTNSPLEVKKLLPLGWTPPPLTSRAGDVYKVEFYVVIADHWFLPVVVKCLTAEDLQLASAAMAFVCDRLGISHSTSLGCCMYINDRGINSKPDFPSTFSSTAARQLKDRIKLAEANIAATPGSHKVLIVKTLKEAQDKSKQTRVNWEYGKVPAEQQAPLPPLPAAPPAPEMMMAPAAAAQAAPPNLALAAVPAITEEIMAPAAAAQAAAPNLAPAAGIMRLLAPMAQAPLAPAAAPAAPAPAKAPLKATKKKGKTSPPGAAAAAASSVPSQRPKRKAAEDAMLRLAQTDDVLDEILDGPPSPPAFRTTNLIEAPGHPQDVKGNLRKLMGDKSIGTYYRNNADVFTDMLHEVVHDALIDEAVNGVMDHNAAAAAGGGDGRRRKGASSSSSGGGEIVFDTVADILDAFDGMEGLDGTDWVRLAITAGKLNEAAESFKKLIQDVQQRKKPKLTAEP